MKLSNIKFFKKKYTKTDNKNHSKKYDRYSEIGKLVKEARMQNNLSIKELSFITKIPESSINSIENNIKELRPKYPFLRSILFKLEKCLSMKDNTLVELATNTLDKSKKKFIIRKIAFLDSWQGSVFYFLFLLFTLFILNRYFISNTDIIEIQIIEEKVNQ